MARKITPIKDQVLKNWLETNFRNKSTIKTYKAALNLFKKSLNIQELKDYTSSNPDADHDIKQFLNAIQERPSKTISCYTAAVKVFLTDHEIELKEHQWRNIRRRGFMPKRIKAQTRDRKPSKAQLKKLVSYMDIKGKALFLFLASSGCRIGETLQLRIEDMNMEADPPQAFVRGETTKNGVGERTVYMSYEAADNIKNWLEIKDGMGKRNGGYYSGDLVFPFGHSTASFIWYNSLSKAGLDERDPRTGRRCLHIHSMRKFFRTQIGLDTDITHALLGHSEYLDDAYVRLNQKEISESYKEAMHRVSVYTVEDQELRKETVEQLKKIVELENKLQAKSSETKEIYSVLSQQDSVIKKLTERLNVVCVEFEKQKKRD